MKIRFLNDGMFDVTYRGVCYTDISRKQVVELLKIAQIGAKEIKAASLHRKPEHNVLHFGSVNGMFLYSSFEAEIEAA